MTNYEQFDKLSALNFSSNIKILPWIGKNYFTTEKRVLILGESVYGEKKDLLHTTINEISNLPNPDFTAVSRSYYTKLVETLNIFKPSYEKASETDKCKFWESVANYEFIQESMPNRKVRPTEQQKHEAVVAMSEIIQKLQPDIIFTSKNVYHHIEKRIGVLCKKLNDDKNYIYLHKFDKDNPTTDSTKTPVYLVAINHPASQGFSPEYWFNKIQQLLKEEKIL